WIVIRVQVKSGVDTFLGGYVGRRIEPVARKLIAELESTNRDQWDGLLKRASQTYGVDFYLFGLPEKIYGSGTNELPESVRRHLPPRPINPRPAFRPPVAEAQFGVNDRPSLGARLADPNVSARQSIDRHPLNQLPPIHQRFFLRSDNPRAYWAGLLMPIRSLGTGMRPIAFLARSDTFSAGGLFFNYTPWLLMGVGMVLFSVLLWLPLVGDLTRTIRRLTHATRQVAEGHFGVRVNEKRGDELGQLGSSVNRMTLRLEGFVKGQKHFLGAIAHELCSPLARLQMALGILEQHTDEKQARQLEDLREEIQHMSDLVNELLSFSKASLKPSEVKLGAVNLKSVAEWAARREAAEDGEVKIQMPADLCALANAELLQRAMANLVRNALRYAGDAGPMQISAHQEGDQVKINVTDQGPGIPEEHLENVFEMFYRIQPDRMRDSGGVGLGLAIVRQCVEACGGAVTAQNRERGGLSVLVQLRHCATPDGGGVAQSATSEERR
ncbi:MAG TPA: HAMP domain-containing sensor histidine kinase, partial [Candidatus Binatia bacterium]|nr:HAMP domain-containing sensor histidine kinase [Candidatus Binatia bacterium]